MFCILKLKSLAAKDAKDAQENQGKRKKKVS
jgi:hypothetical protein